MNYPQTLEYLFSRLPMYSRIGAAAYKDNLDNIITLCEALDNPQRKFRSIHVAGTNGKGSCSHMIAAVLQTAGYKTGLHTSPHLTDFRERIKVNGVMVDEDFVTGFTERIIPQIEAIDPSFFEISVAMAFEYFSEQQVDIAIIETGLGGRLDSTNIIQPELSLITNIGWDHMNLLGNSLRLIAGEKAGIIKQDTLVIIGETLPETLPVFREKAGELNAEVHLASTKREAMEWNWLDHELVVQVAEKGKTDHRIFRLDLPGIYQVKNLITVLEVFEVLQQKQWVIYEEHILEGLRHARRLTGLHGRWQVKGHDPLLVLDVAHNEMGIRQVMEQVEVTDHEALHIVLGMVNDKDISAVLALLPKTATYYFTQANIPRAMDSVELQRQAAEKGLHGSTHKDVNTAINSARSRSRHKDMILVCGSIFLVAEVA